MINGCRPKWWLTLNPILSQISQLKFYEGDELHNTIDAANFVGVRASKESNEAKVFPMFNSIQPTTIEAVS